MKQVFFGLFLLISLNLYSLPDEWEDYFIEQCYEVGVPVTVARAILHKENPELDPDVVSRMNSNGTRDFGLWQLNSRYLWSDFVPRFWHFQERFDWSNPFHSTYIAVRHIGWLYKVFRNEPFYRSRAFVVILAYNCGFYAVQTGNVPLASANYAASVFYSIWPD